MKLKPHILPTIIVSQFACTSLWFAGNAVVDELTTRTGLGTEIIGYVLSSVQLGFIIGTLTFAILMVADRFSPSKVFMICAFLAALCNYTLLVDNLTSSILLVVRFGTGFFLAGIYPIGMKIAADYYEKGLGKALGYLVGALVIGTAFPYLIDWLQLGSNYTMVIKTTSALAIIGGFAMWLLVPHGPYRKPSIRLQIQAGPSLFKITEFRIAAFGYFGHMWELYAFWAFTPLALATYNSVQHKELPISLWTFVIIAVGGVSCVIGGYFSLLVTSKKVAIVSLLISGMFCLISPLLFYFPLVVFLISWCLWGMAVIADSPQFSTLVADSAPATLKGTGITLVNSMGFAISVVSIQLLLFMIDRIDATFIFMLLGIGPILGLIGLTKKSS